ncbi:MAG: shikimate kinase [Gammaproteobacteria bacterium]|nr:shikimate kinase [Gammaproteobacteria bacterium]MBU6509810.1 shikimate kinase [Gammaproteobacteria bacterium]MDE1983691.1 shikimate kinase [Gammaproteobacteria bacterium]MDE2107845.1 shikimate kinase [Gammaproteobacteria bacterium]MDE2460524.1 shikimate kinase [Gammaproteobacteria bacterium]
MGAGKSAIGKELARLLARDFFDSDREIERRTGADIALIFDKEGEAGFRRRERQVIEELTQREAIVLATGGGAVLDAANRECLSARGCVIYLKASVSAQAGRTGRGQQRPLLAAPDREARLRELFAAREPLYESIARITVSTDQGHVKNLARQILREIDGNASARSVI